MESTRSKVVRFGVFETNSGARLEPHRAVRILVLLLCSTAVCDAATLTHGPIVGHTTDQSTRIWVRADQAAEVQVRLIGPDGRTFQSESVRLASDRNYCGQAVVSGLAPQTTYSYQVLLDGVAIAQAGVQRVTTFPEPGADGIVKIGFGHSLIDGGEQIVWKAIAAKRPDLFLLMGDNIYSNSTDPARQRRMYLDYRADPHFQAFAATTPIYAIWDDHDFGRDNSDRTQPGKRRSLDTFNEIWPNPPTAAREGEGIWSKFIVGQAELYLLDVRYHRSPDADPDGPRKTMLGEEQRDWFVRSLAGSDATFKFPVSGSAWNCGGVEAWNHQYLHEYDAILAEARIAGVEGLILLAGDQHQCSIAVRPKESWGGYDLHSWMAGRLHSGGRENQIEGFGMITINTTAQPAEAKLEFFGHDGLPYAGKRLPYTTPGALRGLWDSPPGSMGTPLRSADGEIRHTHQRSGLGRPAVDDGRNAHSRRSAVRRIDQRRTAPPYDPFRPFDPLLDPRQALCRLAPWGRRSGDRQQLRGRR